MKTGIVVWIGVFCWYMFLDGANGQDFQTGTQTGEVIYHRHCLSCHGSAGDGKGPESHSLMVPPRDFHTPESTNKTDLELRSIIIWGLVFSPMHGWWDRLTAEEIRAVVSYIRHLAPYQPRI